MEALIIRHANSLHNQGLSKGLDSSVSKHPGCTQIQRLGRWLQQNFDLSDFKGLTSPYLRTLQTSCGISKHTGLEFKVHGGLREYHIEKNHDDLREGGHSLPKREDEFKDCKIVWPKSYWPDDSNFYANETLDEFFERCQLFLDSLNQHGKYVFVSHGSPCRTLHHILCGHDLECVRSRYSGEEGHFTCSIKNASLTWIKDGEEVWFSRDVYNEDISGVDENGGCGPTTADS